MAEGTIKRVIEIDAKFGADALAVIRSLQDQLKSLEQSSRTTADSVSKFGGVLGSLGGKVAGIGLVSQGFKALRDSIGGTLGAITSLSQGILETQKTAEQLRNGFAAIRDGDFKAAARDVDFVRQAATELNLEFTSAARSYLSLVAATKGTALEGGGVQKVFEAISGAGQKLGLDADRVSRAFTALQQILSKGKVQQEELRGQLTEALPGALNIAARAFGVTTSKLNDMVTSGLDGTEFVTKFAAQIEKELGGRAVEGTNKATAALTTFSSQFDQLKQALAESGPGDAAASQLNHISDIFQNITKRILEARKAGEGFFGQLSAGAAGSIEGLGRDGIGNYVYKDPNARIKQLEALNGGKGPQELNVQTVGRPRTDVLRDEERAKAIQAQIKELNELRDAQRKLKAETDALKAPDDYAAGTSSALDKIRESYSKLNAEYGKKDSARKTELENLEEARKFLPEVAANYGTLRKAIEEKYKVTDKDAEAYGRAKKSADEFLKSLSDQTSNYTQATELGREYSASISRQTEGLRILGELRGKDAAKFREELTLEVKALHDAEVARVSYQAALRTDNEIRTRIGAIDEENKKIRESIQAFLEGKDGVDDLRKAEIARREALIATDLDSQDDSYVEQLQWEIKLLREQTGLIDKNAKARQDDKDKKDEDARTKSEAESFQRILETTITNGIRGGKGFGENIFKSLKDSLEAQAIKILIKPGTEELSKALQLVAKEGQKLFSGLFDQLIQANTGGNGLSGLLTELFSSKGGASGGGGGFLSGIGGLFGGLFGGGSTPTTGGFDAATDAELANVFSSFFAAKGAVMQSGAPVPFATGGIFGAPTNFPMADGRTGLLGEAGPEAIMPLSRGADGKLGVKTTGAGDSGIVVNITNTTGSQVTAREERGTDGSRQLQIMVNEAVNKGITAGHYDRAFSSTYALNRRGRA